MFPPIKVAIAGFGLSARVFHLPFLKHDARFEITHVYERRSRFAAEWLPSAEIVHDFEQLLHSKAELIVITTPNQTHFELAKRSILAKKNVIVEKPLAVTVQQALELDRLANEHQVILSVYQNRRWDNAITTAKRLLEQETLGKVVDCEIRFERYSKTKNAKAWKETGEQGVGLVYDLGVHLLDQAYYLFGKPQAIYADIRYQHDNALSDDNFTIQLYYTSGLKVTLSASKYAKEPSPHFVLHGTQGSYLKAKVDPQEALLGKGVSPIGYWNNEPQADWGILHTEVDGLSQRVLLENAPASYQQFYDNLYAALRENQPLAVTAKQAAEVLYLIEKAYESAKLERKLAL